MFACATAVHGATRAAQTRTRIPARRNMGGDAEMWGCGDAERRVGWGRTPRAQPEGSDPLAQRERTVIPSDGEKLARPRALSIVRVVAPRPLTLYCGMKSSVDEIRRR